jgi:(1->4)-alpha-D-glucan 1-alpha-D-glucosylmutase
MAKSLEDTAFYRYHRLIALNEVGGEPSLGGLTADAFHARMAARARRAPHAMTATATHDTKRGEDARMRILAIAELSGDWTAALGRWKTFNARYVSTAGGQRSPSIVDEYMIYQALVGALPLDGVASCFVERFQQYVQKAVREEKLHSSWLNPNAAYENALAAFVSAILDPAQSPEFLETLVAFAQRTALLGALNSLSQLTLKATVPGVPDLYQGTEFWDLSLVDPDNRRPVDFRARASSLSEMRGRQVKFATSWKDGTAKLAWTWRLLEFRRHHADVFASGNYVPLVVEGRHADHVIAFSRRLKEKACAVVALRHFAPFTRDGSDWPEFGMLDARISAGGMKLELGQMLGDFPAAVFAQDEWLNRTDTDSRVLSLA